MDQKTKRHAFDLNVKSFKYKWDHLFEMDRIIIVIP